MWYAQWNTIQLKIKEWNDEICKWIDTARKKNYIEWCNPDPERQTGHALLFVVIAQNL